MRKPNLLDDLTGSKVLQRLEAVTTYNVDVVKAVRRSQNTLSSPSVLLPNGPIDRIALIPIILFADRTSSYHIPIRYAPHLAHTQGGPRPHIPINHRESTHSRCSGIIPTRHSAVHTSTIPVHLHCSEFFLCFFLLICFIVAVARLLGHLNSIGAGSLKKPHNL